MEEPIDQFNTKPTNALIKFKHILIVLILGHSVIMLGALGKINAEPWGGMLITAGFFVVISSLLAIVIKLLLFKNPNSFLNQ